MKTLVEVSFENENDEKEQFFLLHWGLKMQVINDLAVTFTVAICQNVKTGDILCFYPEQLRILGDQIKNI
jgi:hydrogenase maturation factor